MQQYWSAMTMPQSRETDSMRAGVGALLKRTCAGIDDGGAISRSYDVHLYENMEKYA